MSKYFEMVKNYFNKGLWSITRVRNAVFKDWIIAEEFEVINGETYNDNK